MLPYKHDVQCMIGCVRVQVHFCILVLPIYVCTGPHTWASTGVREAVNAHLGTGMVRVTCIRTVWASFQIRKQNVEKKNSFPSF
jgi:hypothetical protein